MSTRIALIRQATKSSLSIARVDHLMDWRLVSQSMRTLLFVGLTILFSAVSRGQDGDPISKHLFSPNRILQQAEKLALSEEQRMKIIRAARNADREIYLKIPILKSANEALEKELQRASIDPRAARDLLDDVLDAEREIKRVRLQLMIVSNDVLSEEQRSLLKDPGSVVDIHPDASNGVSSSKPPAKPEFKSREKLRAEIEAMIVKDVAWRMIPWKTCLLDGIAASKKEKKPIIFWVFIDRPVDDKRC